MKARARNEKGRHRGKRAERRPGKGKESAACIDDYHAKTAIEKDLGEKTYRRDEIGKSRRKRNGAPK